MTERETSELPTDDVVDSIADDFVAAWLAEEHPRIEDYLSRLPAEAAEKGLRELLALELELRGQIGSDGATPDVYCCRFPNHRKLIESLFVDMETAAAGDSIESTGAAFSTDGTRTGESAEPWPSSVGRFAIQRVIGKGGFGRVYCAQDTQLDRLVAIKGPSPSYWNRLKDNLRARFEEEGVKRIVAEFLEEARKAARLKHPGLVTVYDFRLEDDRPYIVQEFIDGGDLAHWARRHSPDERQVARLMLEVAEAVSHAHYHGFVHRDLKPANVLVDRAHHAHVTDFGLALHESVQLEREGETSGTLPYMSPEQIRGESHRLDGRSDLWSWGVMFYELLVGRKPFEGTLADIILRIEDCDPQPPRQRRPDLSPELARICLKCLEKRCGDRYDSAAALIDDLRHWLDGPAKEGPSSMVSTEIPRRGSLTRQPIRVVPKGLRTFDSHDADFFLELLSGPRDRDGLPESIRFWKTRIEEVDSNNTFSVGLLYGPSGCGKSSLVKAGLMPLLASHVACVYVEATPDETELRLSNTLRNQVRELPDADLPELLRTVREGRARHSQKLLIVLDQFEQWLHAEPARENSELLQALRQCDGGRVQCLLMVRGDFWLAVSRFMRDLEVQLVDGWNRAFVDLFDVDHAQRVLAAFGRAFGRLPENTDRMTEEQQVFLEQATSSLAEENRVICVRLALFAEMMKGRPWTPGVLEEVGGATGLGVRFLEETFGASTAPPEHRYHQNAARAVLQTLLPESGSDIKGHLRSQQELLHASGYADRHQDFQDLVRILDSEVRLISPTDPRQMESDDLSAQRTKVEEHRYQLTHDYLVPSLRDWLTQKQRETRRGRAETLLKELSAVWNTKRKNRDLPSFVEWLNIGLFASRQRRTEQQKRMMRRALRLHGSRLAFAALLFLVLVSVFVQLYGSRVRQQVASTLTAVDSLRAASGDDVKDAIRILERQPPEQVLAELRRQYRVAKGRHQLRLGYGLAARGEVDPQFLIAAAPTADSSECSNIVAALRESRTAALQSLRDAIEAADATQDWAAKARLAIVALHLGETDAASDMLEFRERPDPIQRSQFIETFPNWHDQLSRLAGQLRDATTPALRTGISLSVGRVDDLSVDAKEAWLDVFADWYLTQPDTGTHSAAAWALRAWKADLPELSDATQESQTRDWLVTATGMTMLRIRSGEFVRQDEKRGGQPQKVLITQDFLLGDREVSVGQFRQFMEDTNYDDEKPMAWALNTEKSPTDAHPAQGVSWYDAVMFCNWLSRREGLATCYEKSGEEDSNSKDNVTADSWRLIDEANGYRLPSEAQWEYACRAGTTTRFATGEDEGVARTYGVFSNNSNSRTAICGIKPCNAWGLFDMHGNVLEWCGDWFGDYEGLTVVDPLGPNIGTRRIDRGGSWGNRAGLCKSGWRYDLNPSQPNYQTGFRVARIPTAGTGVGGGGQRSASRVP